MVSTIRQTIQDDLKNEPIRVLTQRYPEILPLLSDLGIDTCCGSSRTIYEAAGVHGFDAETIIQLAAACVRLDDDWA